MIRRAVFLGLLALQVAASASPAAALILCLSNDGCASLEFAAPGTVRCHEPHCDPHAGEDHSCRDIPVLAAAQDMLRGTLPSARLAPAALTRPLGVVAPAAPTRPAVADAAVQPPTAERLRSVVLTL